MRSELDVDACFAEHLAGGSFDLGARREQFLRDGYLKITDLVPKSVVRDVGVEVRELLQFRRRVDISVVETGGTPRRMFTVSARHIAEHGSVIPRVYRSPSLRTALSGLVGEGLVSCPHEPEQFVITLQQQRNDTHGWHWGDYAFTVIWVIECPEGQGALECIPHVPWVKHAPRLAHHLAAHPSQRHFHVSGDVYLLRSDTTLHRTVPLTRDADRIILNTCWGSQADIGVAKTHETMDQMFE